MRTGPFARDQRLLRPAQFQRVFDADDQCRSVDDFFAILARPNGSPTARLGLAIGKKHLKTAVGRNRIKRLVRESFRHHAGDLSGLDIIVLARAGVAAHPANGAL